jgi:hypothetical protein
MTEGTDRAALYLQDPDSRSILTVRTGEELTLSLQVGVAAVAMPLHRDGVQALVATLDDWLYDSRPA